MSQCVLIAVNQQTVSQNIHEKVRYGSYSKHITVVSTNYCSLFQFLTNPPIGLQENEVLKTFVFSLVRLWDIINPAQHSW